MRLQEITNQTIYFFLNLNHHRCHVHIDTHSKISDLSNIKQTETETCEVGTTLMLLNQGIINTLKPNGNYMHRLI